MLNFSNSGPIRSSPAWKNSVTSLSLLKTLNKSRRENGNSESSKQLSNMNSQLWFDVIGWIGAAALLVAYAMISHKKLEGDSATYQLLNISGSILLAANTIFCGSYPSTFVNLIWAGIAVFSVAARRQTASR